MPQPEEPRHGVSESVSLVLNRAVRILNVRLSEADLDTAMAEMDADQSEVVDFSEFHKWWVSENAKGVLTAAKNREEAKRSKYKKAVPLETKYREYEAEVVLRPGAGEKKKKQHAPKSIPRMRRCTVEQLMEGGGECMHSPRSKCGLSSNT